jgi:anti-sigma factor RsiW
MSADRGCPGGKTLEWFLRGQLRPNREDEVNLHQETCPACEAKAKELEQTTDPFIDALRQSRGESAASAPAEPAPASALP